MVRQAAVRSALRCTRSRFPFMGSSPAPVSPACPTQSSSQSHVNSSPLQNTPQHVNLSSLPKSFSPNASETKFASSWRPSMSPVVLSAKLSTVAADETEGAASSGVLEESDSVEDADGRSGVLRANFDFPPTSIQPGHATAEGTARFAERFRENTGNGHFRTFNAGSSVGDIVISSIGLGEYRGKELKSYNRQYTSLISDCLLRGINLIDISHLQRNQHCERVIGHALGHLLGKNIISRDEFILCSKGGMILREKPDSTGWSEEYLKRLSLTGLFSLDDVATPHCMKPTFLEFQLDGSRKNLGVETIDVYYIQNIECQINHLRNEEKFYDRLKDAFAFLETACDQNKIRVYGITARSENFLSPDADNHISLEKVMQQAVAAGGENHRLKFLQIPVNMAVTETITEKTQTVDGELMTTIDAANKLGLYVVSQATDFFTNTYKGLPDKMNYNPHEMGAGVDASKCLQFSRTVNGLGTVLFTSRRPIASSVMLSCITYDC